MSRALLTAFLIAAAVPAFAQQPNVSIAIRDNGFAPAEIEVPSGTKIELSIKNEMQSAAEFESKSLRREKVIPAVFIRAPWVEEVGEGVEVLARVEDGPAAGRIVAVRQGSVMATSFHPEVTGDHRFHQLFVEIVRGNA